ncbi:translocation/assembly module TamB domain-containing protein [Aurantiacibacter marinus]|uniref:translocation/assembly module TamB domain-containing protein n=1 Tax=Aurantiacibacter marinus TaxID=874156 RepID=UPI000699DA34|nr:translocation/assembly module TamB domain-containing protein [Aurantiacibacter marinus]
MSGDAVTDGEALVETETGAPAKRKRRFLTAPLKAIVWLLLGIAALVILFVGFLHTPPGRQFIVDQISQVAPASGLSVEVGEIEGSVLWSATLKDVKFRDANDTLFLEVPLIDLNWRPYKWFTSGLDVRHLVLTDGTLYAAPELIAGDPDAPVLPDFDIRIDRFAIVNLTVAEGLLGEERTVDFAAETNIRDGLVYLDAGGEFGGGDVFKALVHAEPDGDRFDLDLDWQAPRDGFLAAMVGAQSDLSVQLKGDGTWTSWEGELDAVQGGADLLDFDIYNDGGQYRIVGRARPGTYVEGLPARALGETVMLTASGTLEDSVLEGDFVLRASGVNADGAGAIDLANNSFDNVRLAAQLLDPTLFSEDVALNGANLEATLNGAFRDLTVPHRLNVAEIDASGIIVSGVTQNGTLAYDGTRFTVPVDAGIARIVSGNALFDPRLVNGTVGGTLVYAGSELLSDNLAVNFSGLEAQLGLNSNLGTGLTQVTGPVNIADLPFDGIGTIDAGAQIRFAIGGGAPWSLDADLQGRVDTVTNATLANLAGENIRFTGGLSLGSGSPVAFDNMRINASKLSLTLDGRVDAEGTTLAGSGRHVDYGPFTVEALLADDGPRAALVFADPLPAAGLTDVRVVLAPSENGFAIDTQGGSLLGAFDGQINLNIAENGDTFIDITRLDVAQSRVSGVLQIIEGGVAGDLDLSRGGIDGTIGLAVRDGGQGFDIDVNANNARFGGDTPLAINRGTIDASGLISADGTTVRGFASLQGLSYGNIFIGRLAARAQLIDGIGSFDAALTGRRGSRFELAINGNATAERIAVAVDGSYAGRDISMPRRAVLTALEGGGWQLERSQLSFGDGFVLASGRIGADASMSGNVSLANMPLGLADVLTGELGVGGTVSGVLEFTGGAGGLPTGEARLMIEDLTRASSLLTSRPMDIAIVGQLSETLAQARAVISDGGNADGRLQGRIANLPQTGSLIQRLYAGDLFAQLRFNGDAAALWRLAAIDLLDVTGDLEVAADLRGSLGDPQVRGSISGDALRVRSGLTGTDVTGVSARGRFDGSRFNLTSFAGTAPNGGRVSGSGFIDLSGITASRGPRMDIRLAATNAQILDIANMGATITGPMRIVSNGVGGTIAGRLRASDVRWRLGMTAEAIAQLPSVNTRQINLPADVAPVAVNTGPWRYLIDVRAPGGIQVDGMGLESEWRTNNLQIRGTTDDPRLGGEVSVVPRQGFYSFAGTRFEITQGDIYFDENAPIDPRIDLVAETEVDALSVTVNVRGNASQPDIAFSSVPALPEEELLARLLFGGSITNLSATDALQLGAAVASLRGGSGVGPINQLRNAIGLDRLRIVAADPALDRGTSVALGKNFGRRFYVEIITDGAGYSASNVEFRVTSWLNLLATVSTVGRNSAALEYRRDY